MAWQEIPLRPIYDQVFNVTVSVNSVNVPLIMHLRYNTEGEFWHIDISDGRTGEMLVSHIPLVTGEYPAADRLGQLQHLGIGSMIILKDTEETETDIPGLDDLGTDFLLIWGTPDE